jgi:2-keto-4-pentenoate hydratase/2-oxohepta-3-ene-1,7-dioic acid hydratase in catechol pathway
MRLATFRSPDGDRVGVVSGDRVHALDPDLCMRTVVELGLDEALDLGGRALRGRGTALADVRLRAPLQPPSLRDFVTFEEHVEGVRRSVDGVTGVPDAWYDAPTFYFTNPHAVIGPGDDVLFPAGSRDRDFELEVAVVVGPGESGRAGESVPVQAARDLVFGYTILNDWSARDLQRREMQVGLGPAKGKDFASTLGPWIVTADELEEHRDAEGFLDLWCSAEVNGAEVGHDLLSNMGWTFETMIAFASQSSRVAPGDVLGSGTTGNGGCLAELWGRRGRQDPPPLQPGDVVTLHVQGIGSVSNRVALAVPAEPLPPVRRRDTGRARRAARPEAATP